jgi:hypothetical protein
VNQVVVIDFDLNKPLPDNQGIDTRSFEDLYEAAIEYGELPETFMVESPSQGRHLYYRLPDGFEGVIPSKTRFIDKSLSIDIRGDSAYIIAPDEKYYFIIDDIDDTGVDNLLSKCAVLPEWIINYTRPSISKSDIGQDEILPPSEIREIRSALSFVSSDDRTTWINIGLALKSTGSPSAFGLWEEWSKTSSKYNPADSEKRWKGLKPKDITIASLFHEAKAMGWMTTYETQPTELIPPNTVAIARKQQEVKKKPFPEELLHPPGLVGDIYEHILSKSHLRQPVFALSAAIAAVGTLAGRKVQSESGIRTNVYCVNVGGSGSGKDIPRKIVKSLFAMSGCSDMACVDTIASDSAIETAMFRSPAQLFVLDEIGRFFRSTQSKGASSFITNIVSVFLRLYSACDEIYFCKEYADETRKREIDQPHLCLLGSTVPESLYKGLSYESATDGFLSRLLIFETDNNLPKKSKVSVLAKPSERLIDQLVALKEKKINVRPAGNLNAMDHPDPQIVPFSGNAEALLDRFEDVIFALRQELQTSQQIDAMYNRASQMAVQIALIIATGNNIENPVITEHEMNYGIKLAKHITDHLKFVADNFMARNDYEHEVKQMFNVICETGSISLAELSRKTQHLNGFQRDSILENLKDSDQIEERMVGNISFQTRMFFLKT